jgi:hypothetical protein
MQKIRFILFGAALVLAAVILLSCSSPTGSSGVDPKDTFMNDAIAFVGIPLAGGGDPGGPGSSMAGSASVLDRSASETGGSYPAPVTYTVSGSNEFHMGMPEDPYATISLNYLGSARFVVYPRDSLKNYLKDYLPGLLAAGPVVTEDDAEDLGGKDRHVMPKN